VSTVHRSLACLNNRRGFVVLFTGQIILVGRGGAYSRLKSYRTVLWLCLVYLLLSVISIELNRISFNGRCDEKHSYPTRTSHRHGFAKLHRISRAYNQQTNNSCHFSLIIFIHAHRAIGTSADSLLGIWHCRVYAVHKMRRLHLFRQPCLNLSSNYYNLLQQYFP